MKEKTKHSTVSKDVHGFPARTQWSQIGRLKAQNPAAAMEFGAELYYKPMCGYAQYLATQFGPAVSPEDIQDWLTEFLVKWFPLLVRSKITHAPADGNPLFRHLLRSRFRWFILERLKALRAQKRGGHLHQVPLSLTNQDGEEVQREITDARQISACDELDLFYFQELWQLAKNKARQEAREAGTTAEFRVLIEYIEQGEKGDADKTARKLGIEPGALRTRAFRLRQQLQQDMESQNAAAEKLKPLEAKAAFSDLINFVRSCGGQKAVSLPYS